MARQPAHPGPFGVHLRLDDGQIIESVTVERNAPPRFIRRARKRQLQRALECRELLLRDVRCRVFTLQLVNDLMHAEAADRLFR